MKRNHTPTSSDIEFVRFGKGHEVLIILPGLSESLRSVKKAKWILSLLYRSFSRDFTVYIFGRKQAMNEGYQIQDMANDQVAVMDQLGIDKASFLGVSQGGMIAQRIAITYPNRVQKLVLAVTSARKTPILESVITTWLEAANNNDYQAILFETLKATYAPKKVKQMKGWIPIIARLTKPKSLQNFIVQAKACLNHDSWDELKNITAPTLVIGGGNDQIVGTNTSVELASQIRNARLHVYPEYGHAAFEEASDFQERVLSFLRQSD